MSDTPQLPPLSPETFVLPKGLVKDLAALGQVDRFKPREVIAQPGEAHDKVHIVLEGEVRVSVCESVQKKLSEMSLALWNIPLLPPASPAYQKMMGYVQPLPAFPVEGVHPATVADRFFHQSDQERSTFFKTFVQPEPEEDAPKELPPPPPPTLFKVSTTKTHFDDVLQGAFFRPKLDVLKDPSISKRKVGPHSDRVEKELIVGMLGPMEFVSELGWFVPAIPKEITLRAHQRCKVATLPHDVFFRAVREQSPEDMFRILYAMIHQTTRRLMMLERRAAAMAFLDVRERVLRVVLEMAYRPDAMTHPEGTQIRVSRQEIARLAGCSREMAGRAIQDLAAQNFLQAKGKTIVVFGHRDPPRSNH